MRTFPILILQVLTSGVFLHFWAFLVLIGGLVLSFRLFRKRS